MSVAARLAAAGMSNEEAERKGVRVAQLRRELARLREDNTGDADDAAAFWVPGRIEVLGKHTDYGGGRSLLCAVERGICVVVQPRDDAPGRPQVRVVDANSGDAVRIEFSREVEARPSHWSNYAITVARRIALNFGGSLRGADIVFASDLPPAAGVSSSSALVVAIFLALSAVNALPSHDAYRKNIQTPQDLAGYLGAVENGLDFKALTGNIGVGTFGGSEDHTAILCAIPHSLAQYSFSPVTFERAFTLPDTHTFVIGASGILAEKSGASLDQYNGVSSRLRVCLEQWNRESGRHDASMGAAMQSSRDAYGQIRTALEDVTDAAFSSASLTRRFDQFHLETARIIPAAGDALARGDLTGFGDLVDQSQRAAEWGLENQIDETVALANSARKLGAVAASAFGAGFGGSVWALVDASAVDAFLRDWYTTYEAEFPAAAQRATFFRTLAGPPALQL